MEEDSLMKKEIRMVGIDDGCFDKFNDSEVIVVGAFFRGGSSLDGVMSTKADVDGIDSTEKIAGMINRSKFRSQIQAVFLDGIAVGGFNVIDIEALSRKTKIPVIVIIRRKPDLKKIHSALKKLGMDSRIRLLENAGEPVRMGEIYVQHTGIKEGDVREMLRIACTRSCIPEPVRAAHLIAQGITMGESRGNA